MKTLAEFMIIAGADNHPPMLEKSLYDSWKSRMEFYMENRENRRMIIDSVLNGPLVWPTVVQEDGTTRKKTYVKLSATEKLQADCDCKLPISFFKTEVPQMDSGLAVPAFSQGDDPIVCLNKVMAFLIVVASSRFLSTNNQLRTSSNLRNQATIQDDRVTVQQVQGRQGQSYSGTGYKGNATSSGGNNTSIQAREKTMLAKVLESGQILDEEQLAFLADPDILDGQAAQTTIPNNATFQTEDLDAYESDCDDISNAKAVLMANLSNYGSDVISEVPHSESYHNDIDNQSVHAMQDFEQTPVVDFLYNEITSDSNIISYSQYLQETQQATVQDTSLYAQQDSMILSVIEQIVISSQHATSPVIDDEETLILEEWKLPMNSLRTTPDALTKDVLLSVMHSITLYGESVNVEKQRSESWDKCFNLDEHIKSMRENDKEEKVKQDMDEIETINIELEHRKEIIKNAAQIPTATTIVPGILKLDLDPLALSEKKVVVTPMNKVKKVRFSEPLTSSSNIKLVESSKTSDSNTPVLSPTGLKCSTSNCRSTPTGNKKNDRISQIPSSNRKNKVEAQPRKVVQIVLWYLDSRCSKHMTGNHSQLMNFVSKFLGTVRFRNDQIAKIMGYGDYQLGNVIISRVYYVEGLGNNLFSIG
ncbi:hypothetical protein Tco_0189178 [Tanacetum coccineum]